MVLLSILETFSILFLIPRWTLHSIFIISTLRVLNLAIDYLVIIGASDWALLSIIPCIHLIQWEFCFLLNSWRMNIWMRWLWVLLLSPLLMITKLLHLTYRLIDIRKLYELSPWPFSWSKIAWLCSTSRHLIMFLRTLGWVECLSERCLELMRVLTHVVKHVLLWFSLLLILKYIIVRCFVL